MTGNGQPGPRPYPRGRPRPATGRERVPAIASATPGRAGDGRKGRFEAAGTTEDGRGPVLRLGGRDGGAARRLPRDRSGGQRPGRMPDIRSEPSSDEAPPSGHPGRRSADDPGQGRATHRPSRGLRAVPTLQQPQAGAPRRSPRGAAAGGDQVRPGVGACRHPVRERARVGAAGQRGHPRAPRGRPPGGRLPPEPHPQDRRRRTRGSAAPAPLRHGGEPPTGRPRRLRGRGIVGAPQDGPGHDIPPAAVGERGAFRNRCAAFRQEAQPHRTGTPRKHLRGRRQPGGAARSAPARLPSRQDNPTPTFTAA